MEERIKQLEEQVRVLMLELNQRKIQQIRYPIDTASKNTILEGFTGILKTGTSTAPTQEIFFSGNPETVTLPAQPSGSLVVKDGSGNTYNLLYA